MKKIGISILCGIVFVIVGMMALTSCGYSPSEIAMERERTAQLDAQSVIAQANAMAAEAEASAEIAKSQDIEDIVGILSQPNMLTVETLSFLVKAADARSDRAFDAILSLAMEDYNVREAERQEAAEVRAFRRMTVRILTYGPAIAFFLGGLLGGYTAVEVVNKGSS